MKMKHNNKNSYSEKREDSDWVQDPDAGMKGGQAKHNGMKKNADMKKGNVAM